MDEVHIDAMSKELGDSCRDIDQDGAKASIKRRLHAPSRCVALLFCLIRDQHLVSPIKERHTSGDEIGIRL
jgi:hypothetical protein